LRTSMVKRDPKNRRIPEIPPPGERIRLILDTDAAAEVDDQYAIALALLSPERFDIEGFVAAHFGDAGGPDGVERSAKEIETVLDKAGMLGKFPVKRGSHPLRYSSVAEESEGVDFIIQRAMASDADGPLWIVGLGPATDIASAYLKQPEIADHVVVLWHGRTQFWPQKCWNFNVFNDLKAARILFRSDLPFVLFDTGTYLRCSMEESASKIRPHGELGRYLQEIRYRRPSFQSPTKAFFDLGDVATLVDPSLIYWEIVDAPNVNWDMMYAWGEALGKILRIYQIDRDRTFELLYEKLAEKLPEPDSRLG